MKPFLREIAEVYVDNHADQLVDYCFVFPNKRSGVFFSYHLREVARERDVMLLYPAIITISELLSDLTGGVEASRIEQLFILYRVYRRVMTRHGNPDNSVDFNKFQYWGDVLLNDFNDVDKYLVDAHQLFHNIEALKEISSNYLTPEQIDVIRRYWNTDRIPVEVQEFWNHTVHPGDGTSRKSSTGFVKLWQAMEEIYTEFREELIKRDLRYSGMIYREAVEKLDSDNIARLPYKRYIFVGFNVLSASEEAIFDKLMDAGIADFYWDYASPAFAEDGNRATRFLKRYLNHYKTSDGYDIGNKPLDKYPEIEIIGMPSAVGQAKYVGKIIGEMFPDDDSEDVENKSVDDRLLSTAIVLPDETLCMPVIHSLPPSMKDVNITMGYPMRHTPVASLVKTIVAMQLRVRKLRYENTFYYEDVIAVLSHPLIRSIDPGLCDRIVRLINSRRLFNIPVKVLQDDEYATFRPLFEVVSDADNADSVFSYLKRLMLWLRDAADNAETDDATTETHNAVAAVERGFLNHYISALDTLRRLRITHLDDLKVHLEDKTVFHLVDRLVSGESVSFEGMPLKGLQVMGMLETRALDFDNVIITSMNERIFPRKHHTKSFIPNALRRGYGMATLDHQESISAYYFYRLISRASKVYLLYDARTSGVKSGEMSRYLHQLTYIYRPEGLKTRVGFYNMKLPPVEDISLLSTSRDRNVLRRYLSTDDPRYLSASAINMLLNCSLQFYLSYVKGYRPDDEMRDYMDEATYGKIMHEIVERLYKDARGNAPELFVNQETINRLNKSAMIVPQVTVAINKHYRMLGDNNTTPLTGDAKVMGDIMQLFISRMLDHELDEGDFYFIDSESTQSGRLKISDSLTINFTHTIDRIDRVVAPDGQSYIRIVDYKTGSDRLSVKDVASMFDNNGEARPKAIFQLMLYCNSYAQFSGLPEGTRIQPVIYKFRDIASGKGISPLKIGKTELDNYLDFNDEFLAMLDSRLSSVLKGESPADCIFASATDDHACTYCDFTQFCSR